MDAHPHSQPQSTDTPRSRRSRLLKIIFLFCVLVLLSVITFRFFVSPPEGYPVGTIVSIEPGETLGKVTVDFRNKGVVRSSVAFQVFAVLFGAERHTVAGDYLLKKPENVIRLAWRVSRGTFDMEEVKITIPEGFTVKEIGDVLSRKLGMPVSSFSAQQFINSARSREGYLFPDTYFFSPMATTTDIIFRMKANFDAHISPFEKAIASSGYTQMDIVTIASIIEGEARSTQDRRIVAGILWTRLKAGIPLQVDSTLKYVTGRTSEQLTASDLQSNSPYNTYRFKGLPPGPINNPGVDSLNAALNPIQTEYLYFLTGTDGVMRYARTFTEHVANIKKYLK